MNRAKNNIIIVSIFIIAIINGCSEEIAYNLNTPHFFCLEPNEICCAATGGQEQIYFESSVKIEKTMINTTLTELSSDDMSFIKCTPIQNRGYNVSVDFNNSLYDRYAKVFFNVFYKGLVDPQYDDLVVIQKGREIRILNYEEDSYYYPHDYSPGVTYSNGNAIDSRFQIVADGDYDFIIDSTDNWFTFEFSHETNILHVIAQKNQTINKKQGKLTFSLLGLPPGQSYEREWTITQNPIVN